MVKSRSYTKNKELYSPSKVIEPFVLIRYLDQNETYNMEDFYKLPVDTSKVSMAKETYYSALESKFNEEVEIEIIPFDSVQHVFLKMLIARELIGKISNERFNGLVQNYSSQIWKQQDQTDFGINDTRVIFCFIGGVYDRFPDSSEEARIRRFQATFHKETGASLIDKDTLPFLNLCIGIFNLNTHKIEFFSFREGYLELNAKEDYNHYVFEKLVDKLPATRHRM